MHDSSPKGCHPQPFPEMIKTLYFGIAREMHLAPTCERFDISWKRPPLPSFTILSSPFDRNNYSWQGGDAALRTIGGVELMLARGSEEQQIGAELHFWAKATSALSDCSWDLIAAAAAVISFNLSHFYLSFFAVITFTLPLLRSSLLLVKESLITCSLDNFLAAVTNSLFTAMVIAMQKT